MDLPEIGDAVEIATQSLSREFLVDEDEEFGADTKFVAYLLNIFRGCKVHFKNSIRVVHSHILHCAPLLHVVEFGSDGILHRCKVIAQAYVVEVLESLQQ